MKSNNLCERFCNAFYKKVVQKNARLQQRAQSRKLRAWNAAPLQFGECVLHIFRVCAAESCGAANDFCRRRRGHWRDIMRAVSPHDKSQCAHNAAVRSRVHKTRFIYIRKHFAAKQIFQNLFFQNFFIIRRGGAKYDSVARTARIQTEDESRSPHRAAIVCGTHRQAARPAINARTGGGANAKSRIPHQRTVAENMQVARDLRFAFGQAGGGMNSD